MSKRIGTNYSPIHKKQGLNGRVARKKPFINIRNRIEFAVNHLKKDDSWWNDVIFLDGSKFNLFGSDGPNTELRHQNLKPTVKHGGEHVMVWGCISRGKFSVDRLNNDS